MTVVVLWTVVVFEVTVGMVAVVLPESPLEMISAAMTPSATTTTTAKAMSQPFVPDRGCWGVGRGDRGLRWRWRGGGRVSS